MAINIFQKLMSTKHKVKKYLNLLKNAQNMPFVHLVCQNLQAELKTAGVVRADKVLKVVHFLLHNVLRCSDMAIKNREFARLKIQEALVPLIAAQFESTTIFDIILATLVQGLNNEEKIKKKWEKKVELYSNKCIFEVAMLSNEGTLDDDLESPHYLFKRINLVDIVGSSKQTESNLHELMTEYRFLLRDCSEVPAKNQPNTSQQVSSANAPTVECSSVNDDLTKDQLIRELDQQDFKLSDFIDKSFLESCLAPVKTLQISTDLNKRPLSEFINLRATSLLSQILAKVNKRVKKESGGDARPRLLVLSPTLAMAIHYTSLITHHTWEIRQAALAGLSSLISCLKPQQQLWYAFLDNDSESSQFSVGRKESLPVVDLLRQALPSSFLLMLKDQFSDYEDLNVLTPVRFQGLKLITNLCKFAINSGEAALNLTGDIKLIIQNMPQLLFACQDDWQAKLSFFMIMKAIINVPVPENAFKLQVFDIFGKDMLIESLLRVEDSVRITITELLSVYLPEYFDQATPSNNYIDRILLNLVETLKMTDDIEGSVIFAFNLINSIIHDPKFETRQTAFKFIVKVFCPFNFHRVILVRKTYNSLLLRILSMPNLSIPMADLLTLHTLLVQAIIMEEDEGLKRILLQNLKRVCSKVKQPAGKAAYVLYLNSSVLDPLHFQKWLTTYTFTINDFRDSFVFVESPCFQNIDKDYWQLVYQPVTDEEKHQFNVRKLEGCVAFISIISQSAELQGYISQFLQMLQPEGAISFHHIFELLVNAQQKYTPSNLQPLADILPQIVPQRIHARSLHKFGELVEHLQKLVEMFNRPPNRPPAAIMGLWEIIRTVTDSTTCATLWQAIPSLIQQQTQLKAQLSERAGVEIDRLILLQENLMAEVQTICGRYQALCIAQHLVAFCSDQATTLHPKLNDIIYPLLNGFKAESELFYQRVFAGAITDALLPALKKAGKAKPLDGVLNLMLKSFAKEDDYFENRGCLLVVKNWVKDQVFDVQGSDLIVNAFSGQVSLLSSPFEYQIAALKFVSGLLEHHLAVENLPHFQNGEMQGNSLEKTLGNMIALQYVPGNGVDARLTCELFNLCSCLKLKDLQDDLVIKLELCLENLDPNGFIALEFLLDSCLKGSGGALSTGGEEDEDQSEPFNPNFLGNEKKIRAQIESKFSQRILNYLSVFLLPLIKSVHRSSEIFEGDPAKTMQILSKLIQLLPLCDGKLEASLEEKLGDKLKQGLDFLGMFTQKGLAAQFQPLTIVPETELRDYQKQGIHWMRQLGTYGLNCCLCDEMGLGKTIQSLTVVLNEAALYQQYYNVRPLSLVICPNTLTYQWHKEIEKFFKHHDIKSALFPCDSDSFYRAQNGQLDVLITSYEKARSNIEQLLQFNFFYLVLDEGHRIKNAKTKVTMAIKSIKAERKLVLSGTPLQNKVSELWSIFDFLMPNFLENEKVFNSKYNQFLTSNLNKLSEKLEETEKFVQALKSLKKRVAPFILRRTKDQVLKDLPPKVIQDYECEMPPLQEQIHAFIENQYPISQVVQGSEGGAAKTGGSQILQNLILHRKVCNHPIFVQDICGQSPEARQIIKDISKAAAKSNDALVQNSGKLQGLVDLLKESEIIQIGEDAGEGDGKKKPSKKEMQEKEYEGLLQLQDEGNEESKVEEAAQAACHRALIFCQMQSYMQMVVENVLVPYGVKHTQMLSCHTGHQRYEIVEQFNNDPSIKVMVMTTSVGGLGLNLTGADTVIFMEHDWNPMKDLQAIDRAHRIGQKRTVNVYRLILMNTLEQKIMSLQRFKKNLANNLIEKHKGDLSVQDAQSMQIHDLLQCYEEHTVYEKTTSGPKPAHGGAESYKDKVIEEQCGPEIWNQNLDQL